MKKIHPLSIVFMIVGVAGIAFAGWCLYNQQIPGALVIVGCSIVMFAFPSMLNGPAAGSDDSYVSKSVGSNKSASVGNSDKGVLIGTFNGRCRMPDKSSNDCTMQVSTTRLDFKARNGQKLFGMLRSSIKNIVMPNSHTIVLSVESGDYRFISNDADDIQHAYKMLTHE